MHSEKITKSKSRNVLRSFFIDEDYSLSSCYEVKKLTVSGTAPHFNGLFKTDQANSKVSFRKRLLFQVNVRSQVRKKTLDLQSEFRWVFFQHPPHIQDISQDDAGSWDP
ncbi:hypothetical protein AVEN_33851-1 [Araneus ventricosus]|uniref:Uncharacterized protein n=1 Tax=Araneus ventricosus TaxID=182803 RepID=A0A4Y2J5J9_ARAVE|nr:hypothetical protein AVEN_33851-1 [Araneus ventricosus]